MSGGPSRGGGYRSDGEPVAGADAADFLRGDAAADAAEDIEVLSDNWTIVAVFRRCRPQWITGLHAPVYVGISAQEIEAAARLLQVPVTDYPEISAGVDVMAAAAAEVYRSKRS